MQSTKTTFAITLRELLLLVIICSIAIGWYADRQKQQVANESLYEESLTWTYRTRAIAYAVRDIFTITWNENGIQVIKTDGTFNGSYSQPSDFEVLDDDRALWHN